MLRDIQIVTKVIKATIAVTQPDNFDCKHPMVPIDIMNRKNAEVAAEVPIDRINPIRSIIA